MSFIELTILSHDELNGEKILIRGEDIRRIMEVKHFKDKIPDVVSGEKPIKCSLIWLVSGQAQKVAETPIEIRGMLEKK
jgi:hypothetical protein